MKNYPSPPGGKPPPAERYEEALRACPQHGGGVHGWMMGAANLAALAGIPPEQAANEITAAMTRPPSPSSEVRDAVARAFREHGERIALGGCPPPPPPKPRPAPQTARTFIERGIEIAGGLDFAETYLWEASGVRMNWGDVWRLDAVALLLALFREGELVFAGNAYGKTVRPVEEWVRLFKAGGEIPPLFCPNPLKREGGQTAGGKWSPRCDAAVAVFRHAVAEFDTLGSLAEQAAFWVGFGVENVTAITYSGGKSLHALLRVDAASRAEWDAQVRGGIFRKVLIPLGVDPACVNPSRLTRLAGARRPDKRGTVQKLFFLRKAQP